MSLIIFSCKIYTYIYCPNQYSFSSLTIGTIRIIGIPMTHSYYHSVKSPILVLLH